jgi:hypothetical protein
VIAALKIAADIHLRLADFAFPRLGRIDLAGEAPVPAQQKIVVKLGNPAGRLRGSRNRLSEAVISALLRDFSKHGEKAIAKVRRTQPAAYLKCLALLVPREHKVEHSNPLKAMSDEQLDEALAALRQYVAEREAVNVIEGTAEPVALPAPEAQSPEATPEPTQKHKSNRLMREADTAVGPRERRPSKARSPAST